MRIFTNRICSFLVFVFAFVLVACTKTEVPKEEVKLSLNKSSISLQKGKTERLVASVTPADIKLVWSSNNTAVATVDGDGKVTAVAQGSATIEVKADNKIKTCNVTVIGIPVSQVSLNKTTLTLKIGTPEQLIATVNPENADEQNVVWASSNKTVATVDDSGNITALSMGTSNISATVSGKSDICVLTVVGKSVESVTIDNAPTSLVVGQTFELEASINPSDAQITKVTWTSSDPSIATVMMSGKVVTKGEGSVEITATAGEKSAKSTINISRRTVSVGDYYYSDGTSSTLLDATKTVLGVVFSTLNPCTYDTVLKENNPSATHGYVVSLKEIKAVKWQKNATSSVNHYVSTHGNYDAIRTTLSLGSNANKMLGLNNQVAINAFNAQDSDTMYPASEVREFNSTNKSPDTATEWFVTSVKEASLLCSGESSSVADITNDIDNITLVNSKLSAVSGAAQIAAAAYWTSNDESDSKAYQLDMSTGKVTAVSKTENVLKVRPILAF